jgi:hypothetical protein
LVTQALFFALGFLFVMSLPLISMIAALIKIVPCLF